ncbi:Pc4 [Acrasis kona]|uniref:Pc4 n=1 Tax=Acrasis kona TaxID=1008807 RepID=A0AAW2ZED3_9EUKA
MGVTTSCEACASLTNYIAKETHSSILVQLGDILVGGETIQECVERRDLLIHNLSNYNLPLNMKKSQLDPVQELDYLMYLHMNFKEHKIYTKAKNLITAQQRLENLEAGLIRNQDRIMRVMEFITPGIRDGVVKYTTPSVDAMNKIHNNDLGGHNVIDQLMQIFNQITIKIQEMEQQLQQNKCKSHKTTKVLNVLL